MLNSPSPTFLEISNALRIKRGHDFEVICSDYLKARFPNLTPWISTKVESTIAGTPDAFVLDENGNLIAGQYGSQPDWRGKLFGDSRTMGDAEKVAALATEQGLTLTRLIFCTTAEINLVELNNAQEKIKDLYGFEAEICDLRRLAYDLEQLYPGIAARRLNIQVRLQHFITLDAYLDSINQRYWPKREDILTGKIYYPLTYIENVERRLTEERCCLLAGPSGSGKTVLAIAFGLLWQNNKENQRNHPESVVFYLDASLGYNTEAGEEWFRTITGHDYQHELYIIDNCHLSPLAVNAFFNQWLRRPTRHASVILISASRSGSSPWEGEPEDYFTSFEQSEKIINVMPERIYQGLLLNYSNSYNHREPDRFVPIELDLADETLCVQLEQKCSHNLAVTKNLLDTWIDTGGRFSDVTEDVALDLLSVRYLTADKSTALGPLCSLAQFDVPAHDTYINALLSPIGVENLRRENLISVLDSPRYGRCSQVAFHPQVARQIFRAYVRQQVGSSYKSHLKDFTLQFLKGYLLADPPNFVQVYPPFPFSESEDLRQSLFLDNELQVRAASLLVRRPLIEAFWYFRSLFSLDPTRAGELLGIFAAQKESQDTSWMDEPDQIAAPKLAWLLKTLNQIDPERVKASLGKLSGHAIGNQLRDKALTIISQVIQDLRKIEADQRFIEDLFTAMDPQILALKMQDANLQRLHWLFRDLRDFAPNLKAELLCIFSPAKLANNFRTHHSTATAKHLTDFEHVLGSQYMGELLKELGDEQIVEIFNNSTLAKVGFFLGEEFLSLESAYERFAGNHLRDKLASESLKNICKFILRLNRIAGRGRSLARQAVNLLLQTDFSTRVAESDIEDLAILLLNINQVESSYPTKVLAALSSSKAIDDSLAESGIKGIQLFLHNVFSMAPTFSSEVRHSFWRLDLSDQIPKADLKDVRYLLWNVHSCLGWELAKIYCRMVSSSISPNQLVNGGLSDLEQLLWCMVRINEDDALTLLTQPLLQERLLQEWETQPGLCVQIIGMMAIRQPHASMLLSQAIRLDQTSEKLAAHLRILLEQQNAPSIALFLLGLQSVDANWSTAWLKEIFDQQAILSDRLQSVRRQWRKVSTQPLRDSVVQAADFVDRIAGN